LTKKFILSPRLKLIADMAAGGKKIADIGCDHGKVSVYLAEKGSEVYAVDISEPSLEKAIQLAEIKGVRDRIKFYCDDGLDSIKNIDFNAIIIAGMGWRMIADILENNKDCVKKAETLILQPMDSVIDLRGFICRHQLVIRDEKLVWDEGRLYTIFSVQYGTNQSFSEIEMILGPKILENKDILLDGLIKRELDKRKKIISGLYKGKVQDTSQIGKIEREINTLSSMYRGET